MAVSLQKGQKVDLTKGNPKIIYINTTENTMTIDDSIFLALMCNLGYDVLMIPRDPKMKAFKAEDDL